MTYQSRKSAEEIADGILSIKSGVGFQRLAISEAILSERREVERLKELLQWVMEIVPHSFWVENRGRQDGYLKIKETLK